MLKEEILYRYFCYLLFLVVILNSAFNFIQINIVNYLTSINFYDLIAGLLLFTFLYLVGNLVKKILKFDSVSVGIIAYLFSFFIIDSLILFFYQQLSFIEIVLIVNLLWLPFFIFKSWNVTNLLQIIFSIISLRLFFDFFESRLTKNKNIIGDVEAVFFNQAKNIYEGSYFNSVNNYIFEGYPTVFKLYTVYIFGT